MVYLQGASLNLYFLYVDNKELRNIRLDSNNPIRMIPSWYWQAASCPSEFTLTRCCVGSRFQFKDFEMPRNIDPSLRPAKATQELI